MQRPKEYLHQGEFSVNFKVSEHRAAARQVAAYLF